METDLRKRTELYPLIRRTRAGPVLKCHRTTTILFFFTSQQNAILFYTLFASPVDLASSALIRRV